MGNHGFAKGVRILLRLNKIQRIHETLALDWLVCVEVIDEVVVDDCSCHWSPFEYGSFGAFLGEIVRYVLIHLLCFLLCLPSMVQDK